MGFKNWIKNFFKEVEYPEDKVVIAKKKMLSKLEKIDIDKKLLRLADIFDNYNKKEILKDLFLDEEVKMILKPENRKEAYRFTRVEDIKTGLYRQHTELVNTEYISSTEVASFSNRKGAELLIKEINDLIIKIMHLSWDIDNIRFILSTIDDYRVSRLNEREITELRKLIDLDNRGKYEKELSLMKKEVKRSISELKESASELSKYR